jgi:predicted branched-subunit amino acid permease
MPAAPLSALLRHPAFRLGVRHMAPLAAGIGAWGLMTGVAMVKAGMSLPELLLMAVFVFAGSSQLAAVPLIAAAAPTWVILATAFCVNLRFIVFSAHLRPYVMHQPFARRLLSGYLMADLTYVLFVQRHPAPADAPPRLAEQDAYWHGICAAGWTSWVVASLVGIAFANSIPLAWGLGFAGILALLGILCSLVATRLQSVAAGVAGAAAVAAYALPLKLNILVAIAAAVAAALAMDRAGAARRALARADERPRAGDEAR